MIIKVQIIGTDNLSKGRYNIPESEYDALVKYITKRMTEDVIIKIVGKACEADTFRPWNKNLI